jgi:hypothetical protein
MALGRHLPHPKTGSEDGGRHEGPCQCCEPHGATTAILHEIAGQLCAAGPSTLARRLSPAADESPEWGEIRYRATELAAELNAEPTQVVATTEE